MQDKTKTILVTGATGFIGQHLCQQLLGSGYRVKALLRSFEQAKKLPQGLEHLMGDLSDISGLLEACEGVDVIVHLAGVAHVNNVAKKVLHEVNIEGTRKLLQAAIDKRVTRFVFISSSFASTAENSAPDSTSYGQSKLVAEQLLHAARARGDIENVVLRPVNVYGRGMKGNLARMASLISRGRLPPLPRLDTKLSLVGVEDLTQAIMLSVEAPQANGKIYYVTDGIDYTVQEIEQAIYAALGKKLPAWKTPRMVLYIAAVSMGWVRKILNLFGLGNRWAGGITERTYKNLVTDNAISNDQLCDELGFKPTTSFHESLPRIL